MVQGAARSVSRRHAPVLALAIAVMLAACTVLALRIPALSSRVFWSDEAITALRVSGGTAAAFTSANADGRPHTVADILQPLRTGGGIAQTVSSLAAEDAQHPPLFYVAARVSTSVAGFSIASLRVPALIFGLLLPFAMAWLCRELFGNVLACTFGFAFGALSPVLAVYSVQAREYSAWAFFLTLLCCIFLRAVRTPGAAWWIAYAACAAVALYSDVLAAVTIATHAAYAALAVRGRRLGYFTAAAVLAVAAFAPWALEIYVHRAGIGRENGWTAGPWPAVMLAEKWAFNAGTAFWDVEFVHASAAAVLLPIALLASAAIVWCLRSAPARARLFNAVSIAVPTVLLFVPDVVGHHHRSSVTRYGMPLWIALLACVAGYLASRIRVASRTGVRAFWIGTALLLVCACGYSTAVALRSAAWWDNRQDGDFPAIANSINAAPQTLTVVSAPWPRALDLAFYLRPDARLQIGGSMRRETAFVLAHTAPSGMKVKRVYGGRGNAQAAAFRGGADPDALTLWRVVR